jgi:hypothetical protein
MDWIAHSFLAASPIEPSARMVTPPQGFFWGFTVRNQSVDLVPLMPLLPNDWDSHLAYLRAAYPGWRFGQAPSWEVGA